MRKAIIFPLAILLVASLATVAFSYVSRVTEESSIGQSDARTCGQCHNMEMSLWVTHAHSRALLVPGKDRNFYGASYSSSTPGYKKFVKGKFTKDDVKYAYGSLEIQILWTKTDRGHELLPASWDIGKKRWEKLSPLLKKLRASGVTLEKNCIGCHVTGYDPETDTYTAPGITCVACHTDYEKHLVTDGQETAGVAVDKDPAYRAKLCGRCHAHGTDRKTSLDFPSGTSSEQLAQFVMATPQPGKTTADFWPDGTERAPYMEYQGFIQSGHLQADLSCTTCHLPHGSDDERNLKRRTDSACDGCHNQIDELPVHNNHPGKATCVDCHMARISDSVIAKGIYSHTHTFKFLEPENAVKWQMPDSCTTSRCHTSQDDSWAVEILKGWRGQ